MGNASDFTTVIHSIPQWGWFTFALVVTALLVKFVWWFVSKFTTEFHRNQVESHAILVVLKDGARIKDSDPPRYVGLAEIMETILENRTIADRISEALIEKCAGMKCPMHETMRQTMLDFHRNAMVELKDFSARAETSRAETKLLVQGIADDVRTITEHTFPLIGEIVHLVRNGNKPKGE